MRTYRRLFQIFFLALILGSASGCAMFQPDDPGYNNPQRAQNIVRTASSQEGKQYRMGGASPSRGFDCSGLIWWAYRQNGLKVPRVTVDQARAGYAVPKSSPRPGDIMVFRTSSGPRGLPRTPSTLSALTSSASMPATIPSSTAPAAARPYAGRTCSPTGATGSSRYAASSSDPFAGKNEKSAGDRAFFVLFSRHPARQAALSRIPAFFLCGRRGWHLAIRSFLT